MRRFELGDRIPLATDMNFDCELSMQLVSEDAMTHPSLSYFILEQLVNN